MTPAWFISSLHQCSHKVKPLIILMDEGRRDGQRPSRFMKILEVLPQRGHLPVAPGGGGGC